MPRTFNSFYAGSGMSANPFLPLGFGVEGDRNKAVQAASLRRMAPEILALLREQNESFPASRSREENLLLLGQSGSVAVVTGQQVGLFLGPLYTVAKAASAVAVARMLTRETGVRCLPIFWLQTEDHDFAEIATVLCPIDGQQSLRLTLQEPPGQIRCAIADRTLGPDVTGLLDVLEAALGDQPFTAEVVALLRAHYRPGITPGRAFAGVLAELFSEDGLLVFDPRCATVANRVVPLFRSALLAAPQLDALLEKRGEALQEAGFAEQIPRRPGSPLVFFHPDSASGPRYRLGMRGERYDILGTDRSIVAEELLAILDRDPLRFSTSALLRPILQDTLLPTAVYVGGPAEVSYFAQITALYPAFDLPPPLVVERGHVRLIPRRIRELLEKMELTTADFDHSREEIHRKLSTSQGHGAVPGVSWAAELEQKLDALAGLLPAPDPKLPRATERTRRGIRMALERLGRRYERALVERDQVLASRLSRLEGWLRPDGSPPERVYGFPAYAARVGLSAFRASIMSAIDPLQPALSEINL
jgi:bacillithiol biosynthesis cysteine-adding enzyme BshC